ncbi:tyrosine-type recombinase/integrase [Anaerosporobacter sp.]|uniref:tyrosine-type recombinase/integrase n=1 Tax=Anaerosporobacter sp. TaxID=1872529 RepID=UPI0028A04D1D|nr:site-specific integrase [Anaerosporobacter sp.]
MARRGENIYKRKDGRWEARLLVQKGKYQYFYGKSYKEAKGKMLLLQKNQINYKEKQTVSTVERLESWLEKEVYFRVRLSTYENYYHCMKKYIIPFFEKNQNSEITKEAVVLFTKELNENTSLADSTKKKILSILKIALKDVLPNDENKNLIINEVKFPRFNIKEVDVFSLKEQQCLEAAVLHSEDPRALGIILCLYTGIRLGELCALTWRDIDCEAGMMSVTKTILRVKNFNKEGKKTSLVIGATKSQTSIRKIPIPEFLLNLVAERNLCSEDKNTYVLTGKEKPIDPRNFQRLYKKILAEANLSTRKFHTIRHTFATRGLELGVDIKTLSEMLGHSNVAITLNIYAHSLVEQKKIAIQKFNAMYISTNEVTKFAV